MPFGVVEIGNPTVPIRDAGPRRLVEFSDDGGTSWIPVTGEELSVDVATGATLLTSSGITWAGSRRTAPQELHIHWIPQVTLIGVTYGHTAEQEDF